MNFKSTLMADAVWMLVEIALTLTALLGQPEQAKSQATPGPEGAPIVRDIPQTPWFQDSAVQGSIRLTPEQYSRLNKSYTDSWTRYNEGLAGLRPNLADDVRLKRRMELYRRFNEDFNTTLDEIYTDREARRQYDRLYHQYLGYGAFDDPAIRKSLKLTPQQVRAFNDYEREWNKSMRELRREYPENQEGTLRRLQRSQSEMRERINDTLNEDQRRAWSEYIGDPYHFSADVYFPRTAE